MAQCEQSPMLVKPLPWQTNHLAALEVCRRAVDKGEARELLLMLGLIRRLS
jgi:hypothetical protein